MDRTSFFSACSFLIPLRSAAWPPKEGCTTLIGNDVQFFLSAELLSLDKASRPLFFHSIKDQDPAMTPVQLCKLKGAFYIRIGSDVFLLNAKKACETSVTKAVYKNDDDDDEGIQAMLPPSLILEMENVILRIFRNRFEPDACKEDASLLTKVCHTLVAARAGTFSVNYDEVASPCRISICESENNDSSSTELLPDTKKRQRLDDYEKRVEKRRANHREYLSSLSSLDKVLHQPVSEPKAPNVLTPLLNRIADCAAGSYVLAEELAAVVPLYEQRMSAQQSQVDEILDEFFPARGRNQGATPKKSAGESREFAERLEQVLRKQEDIAETKYECLLLPRRG